MKIIHCLNHFLPQQTAGTEVYTWALAKALQQKGHEVAVVIPNYKSFEFREYEYDGLLVKCYPEPDNKDKLVIMGKKAPDGIHAFKELIGQMKPDIVHVQELAGSNGIGIYHLRVLNRMRIKVIFTMHLAGYSCFCGTLMYKGKELCSGEIDIKRCTKCALSMLPISNVTAQILYHASMPLYNFGIDSGKLNLSIGTAFSYPFLINKLQTSLFEIADLCEQLVVLTDWYKEVLLKNGIPQNKISLIKQALPYTSQASETGIKVTSQSLQLIFIGRIDPLKGLHILLEAMMILPEQKITLDIFGVVNDEHYFRIWKDKTKDKTNIFWKGFLEQKDVVNTIMKYDVLCLPSTFSEMSPLVIQEAFAAGIPVLASNVYGNAEQIKDGVNGWLFTFNSVKSLQAKLQALIDKPELIETVKRNLPAVRSFAEVADEYETIYKMI